MKREEIEKAIENGDRVWVLDKDENEIEELYFYKNNIYEFDKNDLFINKFWIYEFRNLFKTKAEAEHYLHHANISRTEHLPFLTWEDIENYISNMKHFGLNRNDKVLARIITKDSIYYFKLCKDFDLFTFQLKQTYIGEDLCEQIRDKFPVSLGETTEANFYKAYDECVRLFKEG